MRGARSHRETTSAASAGAGGAGVANSGTITTLTNKRNHQRGNGATERIQRPAQAATGIMRIPETIAKLTNSGMMSAPQRL